jgi:hypothetical protein
VCAAARFDCAGAGLACDARPVRLVSAVLAHHIRIVTAVVIETIRAVLLQPTQLLE